MFTCDGRHCAVAMLLALLLLAHAHAEWVEITQLPQPSRAHLPSDAVEFHESPSFSDETGIKPDNFDENRKSRLPYSNEPSPNDRKRRPQLATVHDRPIPQVSIAPNDLYDGKRFKPHISMEPLDFSEEKDTQLPTGVIGFHNEKRLHIQFSTEPAFLSDVYHELSNPQFSTAPNDLFDAMRFKPTAMPTESFDLNKEKRLKTQFTTEAIGFHKEKRLPVQFSTEPGFLADYKRNRIYINHSVDHSSENHWSKGVVHRVPNPTTTIQRVYLTTEEPAKVKYEETDLAHELNQGYTVRNHFNTFEYQKPEFVTKEETFEDDGEDELNFIKKPPADIWVQENHVNANNGPKNQPKRRMDPVRRVDIEETEYITNKTPSTTPKDKDGNINDTNPDGKAKTMENVLKFVKVVADTISTNTRRSVNSKLRYLEDLKETIMVNIEDRIESLWPDETGTGGDAARRRRWARAAGARAHHVEFPSSESALMTISFLTFAVYLIKLVLQVIQSYKNKTMMVTPAVFAAVGRAASGRQEPSSQ